MHLDLWLAFFAASWAISLSPGAGAVAAMSAGMQFGFARGYWLSFGLVLGLWSQLVLVGAGVGAVLVASETAFDIVKWAGVVYLVLLAVSRWFVPAANVQPTKARQRSRLSILVNGWTLNSFNPKGTAFMLAVVPQFIEPTEELLPQYLVIAATLAFTDLVVNAGYTAFAARAFKALGTPRRVRWVNRGFSLIYLVLAGLLAVYHYRYQNG
ncbi:MAG TPA: LysE family transporter [Burkholderiaceae bacterium]|nr:LysE family transporter [Burkholderiaceae bacterium]